LTKIWFRGIEALNLWTAELEFLMLFWGISCSEYTLCLFEHLLAEVTYTFLVVQKFPKKSSTHILFWSVMFSCRSGMPAKNAWTRVH